LDRNAKIKIYIQVYNFRISGAHCDVNIKLIAQKKIPFEIY